MAEWTEKEPDSATNTTAPQRNGRYDGKPSQGQEWTLDGDILFTIDLQTAVGDFDVGTCAITVDIHFSDGTTKSVRSHSRSTYRDGGTGDSDKESYQGITSMFQLNNTLPVERVVVSDIQTPRSNRPNMTLSWGTFNGGG